MQKLIIEVNKSGDRMWEWHVVHGADRPEPGAPARGSFLWSANIFLSALFYGKTAGRLTLFTEGESPDKDNVFWLHHVCGIDHGDHVFRVVSVKEFNGVLLEMCDTVFELMPFAKTFEVAYEVIET